MAMPGVRVLEVSTFIFILFAFEYLASGHLFPLDILPQWLGRILYFTPFPYQLYFPISIYMGKTTSGELARGMIIQFGWVIAIVRAGAFRLESWDKKYAAVGG